MINFNIYAGHKWCVKLLDNKFWVFEEILEIYTKFLNLYPMSLSSEIQFIPNIDRRGIFRIFCRR